MTENAPPIHFLATMDHVDYQGALDRTASMPRTRTVGFFRDEKDARAVLEGDPYDLHEGRYLWAVIETIAEGLYPTAAAVAWFRYDRDLRTWNEVPPPETAKMTSNFTMG